MRKVVGAVLAGGGSRRFGTDKAVALLAGKTLIERAMEQLARVTDTVVVCGRHLDEVNCLYDQPHGGLGPLGGLQAALFYAVEHGSLGILSTGCDMPFFPVVLAEELMRDGPAVTIDHHLAGYWPTSLAPTLREHLRDCPDRSMRKWIAVVQPRLVAWPAGLPNINTPCDLSALEKSFGG